MDNNEWIYDRLPTFEDISKNHSPYFLCVVKYSSYPHIVAFSTKDNKWYDRWEGNAFVDEEQVMAWKFMPDIDYDFIKEHTTILTK